MCVYLILSCFYVTGSKDNAVFSGLLWSHVYYKGAVKHAFCLVHNVMLDHAGASIKIIWDFQTNYFSLTTSWIKFSFST